MAGLRAAIELARAGRV
ncbi:MAG: hypothetical protein ACPL7M_03640, partial [Bryobacteraceae bacterium]